MATSKAAGNVAKVRDIVNITDPAFGGKGNGTTDNATAWVAAVALGAALFVPEGTFILTPQSLSSKTVVYGSGIDKTIIKRIASDTTAHTLRFANGADGSVLRDMTLDGNKANTTASTCVLRLDGDLGGFTAERVRFTGGHDSATFGDGVYIGGSGSRTKLKFINCQGDTNDRSGFTIAEGVNGCQVLGGEYYSNAWHGLHIEGGTTNPITNVEFNGCNSHSNTKDGAFVGGQAGYISTVNIVGGMYWGNALNGVNFGSHARDSGLIGAMVTASAQHGVVINQGALRIRVVGNHISGNGTSAGTWSELHLDGTAYGGINGGNYCTITGNVGLGGITNAVYGIREVSGAGNNAVSGNNFNSYGTANYTFTYNPSSSHAANEGWTGNGTWSVVLKGSSTAGTQTYSANEGRWTRYGQSNQMVHVEGELVMTAKDGTTSGQMLMSLPSTLPIKTGRSFTVPISAENVTMPVGGLYLVGYLLPGSSTTDIYIYAVVSAAGYSDIQAAAIANTTAIRFSFDYETSAA